MASRSEHALIAVIPLAAIGAALHLDVNRSFAFPACALLAIWGLLRLVAAPFKPAGARLLRAATAVLLMAAPFVANQLLDRQDEQVIDRSAPLIAAIDIYRAEHGRFPESLDALVPEYIRAVPHAKKVRPFQLMRGEQRSCLRFWSRYFLGFQLYCWPDRKWHLYFD